MRTIAFATKPLALGLACAPVSAVEPRPLATTLLSDPGRDQRVVGGSASTDASWLPQVHQVRVQAELIQGVERFSESYGSNGSTVKGTDMGATKRFVEGARGVPPRGRPV